MQVVGDCFYDSFLHQLYLKKDEEEVKNILENKSINFCDNYYKEEQGKITVTDLEQHSKYISLLRNSASIGYRNIIEEINQAKPSNEVTQHIVKKVDDWLAKIPKGKSP
jgi:hypothetical protein